LVRSAVEERRRRVLQLENYLALMSRRVRQEGKGESYAVIDEEPEVGAENGMRLAGRVRAAASVDDVAEQRDDQRNDPDPYFVREPDPWTVRERSLRFMQFGFCEKWFFMEMTISTLAASEAARLLDERTGFRYAGTGQPWGYRTTLVRRHDPFGKVYLYGDEGVAAEDAAWVWFNLWKFPLDSALLVRAASFDGRFRFEHGHRLA
ncbi:MAG: hypothetical protein K8T20_09715, partial [Planctomycetes bacterium]|nr:hypothetical protein [Planctomycetota bacterium]